MWRLLLVLFNLLLLELVVLSLMLKYEHFKHLIYLVLVFQHQMIILENGLMVFTPVNILTFLIMKDGKGVKHQSFLVRQRIQEPRLAVRLWNLL